MIEQGIVVLIQTGLGDAAPVGGFASSLPKDQISASQPTAWLWRAITSEAEYVLEGQDALTHLMIQIDSHGYTAAGSIQLARAIDNVLRGSWHGTLPDPDNTVVLGIFRCAAFIDGYDDTNRSFVRSVDYMIDYYQA